MRIKLVAILLFFSITSFSQNDSLLKKKCAYSYHKYNVYGFFDVVRFAGGGLEYRPNPLLGLDLKVGIIFSHSFLEKIVGANDFFYMHGTGFMFTPKLYPLPKKHFYVGLSVGYYAYGYKNTWTEAGVGYDKYNAFYHRGELRDRQTSSFTFGQTIGYTQDLGNINFEAFLGLAIESTSNKLTIYNGYDPYKTYPYSYNENYIQPNVFVGIKIGVGVKKQKLLTRKYHTTILREAIVNYDNLMLNNYYTKKLPKHRLREYYDVRNTQYDNIRKAYIKSANDTAALNNVIRQGYKNITTYVNYIQSKP